MYYFSLIEITNPEIRQNKISFDFFLTRVHSALELRPPFTRSEIKCARSRLWFSNKDESAIFMIFCYVHVSVAKLSLSVKLFSCQFTSYTNI